jgi:hypothetical protein
VINISIKLFFLMFSFLIVSVSSAQFLVKNKPFMNENLSIRIKAFDAKYIRGLYDRVNTVESEVGTNKMSSTLNKINSTRSHKVTDDFKRILNRAKIYEKLTSNHYRFLRLESGEMISSEGSEKRMNGQAPFVESEEGVIELIDPEASFDFHWFKFGFAVDEMLVYLRGHQVTGVSLNFAGSIHCMDECSLSLMNPYDIEEEFAEFTSKVPGVTISQRSKKRMIKARTVGLFSERAKKGVGDELLLDGLVVVTTLENSRTEALASAVMAMPADQAKQFLSQFTNTAFLVVDGKGEIFKSDNFDDYFSSFKFVFKNWKSDVLKKEVIDEGTDTKSQ